MTKIKGCSVIYQPGGRALEYADLAVNLFRGCNHGCVYCFVPSMPWVNEQEFRNEIIVRESVLEKLEKDARVLQARGETRRVLMSFTTDPFCGGKKELNITMAAIHILHKYDIPVQILTKGGIKAKCILSSLGPMDAFASTLTFTGGIGGEDQRWREWEPAAQDPGSRRAAMKYFHEDGVPTWASLEPVIDPVETLKIIEQTHEYVNLYKVGKLNYANRLPPKFRAQVEGIDWAKFALDAVELLESLGKSYLIKDDLKAYLPEVTK